MQHLLTILGVEQNDCQWERVRDYGVRERIEVFCIIFNCKKLCVALESF